MTLGINLSRILHKEHSSTNRIVEELGLNQFDFEGSRIQPVEQFFRKFGGKLTPYYTVSLTKPSVKLFQAVRSIIGKGLRKFGLR